MADLDSNGKPRPWVSRITVPVFTSVSVNGYWQLSEQLEKLEKGGGAVGSLYGLASHPGGKLE